MHEKRTPQTFAFFFAILPARAKRSKMPLERAKPFGR
nr:MAG TPA: hypothetical protein [Caudoviricetes sp.]